MFLKQSFSFVAISVFAVACGGKQPNATSPTNEPVVDEAPPDVRQPTPPPPLVTYDVNTDEAVQIAIGKLENRPPDDFGKLCISRSQGFPGLVVARSFVNDRGCRDWYWFVNGVPTTEAASASQMVMKSLFASAKSDAEREKIALRWTEEAYTRFQDELPKDHVGKFPSFHPPKTGSNATKVWVLGWKHAPIGMIQRPPSYDFFEFVYDKKTGALLIDEEHPDDD